MTGPGTTLSEKLGASAGAWAALYLAIHYLILSATLANPTMPEAEYARTLVAERLRWESATALRVMAGIMIVWFMGSLAGRLRQAEGEAARLSTIAFGLGVMWGGIWLLSAMFNSVAIALVTQYPNLENARLAAVLAAQTPMILTPAISFALILATGFATTRYGGYPKAYATATAGLSVVVIVLAIVEWYGPGNLGPIIMTISLAWLAVTSLLTIQPYRR
ncbi:MAG: hypothetical protein ABI665_04805 [Vicinamibacterales bacterium]